jgi:hypothetical protein
LIAKRKAADEPITALAGFQTLLSHAATQALPLFSGRKTFASFRRMGCG